MLTASQFRHQAATASATWVHEAASMTPNKPHSLTTEEYLQRWQEQYGVPNKELLDELGIEAHATTLSENLIRLGSPDDIRDVESRDEDVEDSHTAAFRDPEDMLDEQMLDQILRPGDLVEMSFLAEREPLVAVFVQQFGNQGQFYGLHGKWFYRKTNTIQFSVPGYVDPKLLEPIIRYLPKGEVTSELLDTMQILDVNAPREVAAPVLKLLGSFAQEADAAYRQHASALDRAHRTLGHQTDLRFGTLQKITETLLKSKNPTAATMYAVRKALLRQGLGFQIDKRSHRQTNVFQIMPIEFKERVEKAQSWIREFQDETARRAHDPDNVDQNGHQAKESVGAANVRKFIQKARKLIDQSRSERDFTPYGRLGISKTRTEITPHNSATAEEIDDGVSVEHIDGTEEYWAHVHIANPTAFLPRTHLISKMAAHLTETIYMPERTYSMLPKWISNDHLSLGPDRPCLTISIKLNKRGEVLDEKIQSGIIRKFIPITPQTLQQVVDEEGAKYAANHPGLTVIVGGEIPEHPKRKMKNVEELSKRHKEDLRTLHALALARQARRTEAGGIFFNQNYPEMTVYNDYSRPGLPWSHPSHSVARYTPAGVGNDLMVREMMLLAGEVGALWLRKRSIPAVYRGTMTRSDMMSIEEYREKIIKPTLDANGNPPVKVAFNYLPHAGSSVTSTKPLPHQVLGVRQYAKLTSPLRRYGDMLMHWQIESALRKEAELGHSLIGYTGPLDFIAFQKKEVDAITTRLASRERLIAKTKRHSQAFWLSQLFFRAFYYGEAVLPETFEVIVFSKGSGDSFQRVAVLWQDYSFDMDMAYPTTVGIDEKPEIGDRWEVRIVKVHTYLRRVMTVPVRLISREHVGVDMSFLG
ncbi:putative mitochondrial protein cyt-4 protein [Neofusicoccum parvum UCRNP2]|uniref:Ribonuclease II/R n=2 Tax=Neofusicoccum parvum TaxID=310453 RepID=A0ACB5RPZ5_9PEZI|nr:putative mitochondrial protein cyt-4 protein [Neofusicoccum parvum UCRNP2]GME22590.1 Ribonuclease II/R [Neofusicoccum parvum]